MSFSLTNRSLAIGAMFAVVVLACAAVGQAASYTSGFLAAPGHAGGNNWQTLYTQGFTTSLGETGADTVPNPNPSGLSPNAGDPVSLTQFQFFKSGTADTATNIRLAISNTMYPDLSTFNTGSANFVGLSTNTILDTTLIATGDPITFNFANLPLVYGNNYSAIYVNVGIDPGNGILPLTPIRVSSLAVDYPETPPGSGIYLPSGNYGGDSNYTFATSNFINGNFFNAFAPAADADFLATFNAVPEPSSLILAVGGFGVLALGIRRRSVQG
ncbi:MAG TPA: PEP-CTERM sorting domain-containing protein [Pirellulales bacterium]|jgi:hypothetical protein